MQTATRPDATSDPSTTPDAVRLSGLVKRFGSVTAVDGVDLAVRPGEIVAFLGPNGAGKTTTIDMMLGFSKPDAGTVEILGGTPVAAVAQGRIAAGPPNGGPAQGPTVPPAAEGRTPPALQPGALLKPPPAAAPPGLAGSLFPTARPVEEVLQR